MFVFATFALLGGFLIWKLYLAIDSDEYPLKSYTELSETVLGKYFVSRSPNMRVAPLQTGGLIDYFTTRATLSTFSSRPSSSSSAPLWVQQARATSRMTTMN